MKHQGSILLLCAATLTVCSACGNTPTASVADVSSTDEPSVVVAQALGDRNSATRTLEELSAASDVILRATAAEITHTVTPGTDCVMTIIQPEVIQVVKGDYQGESLVTPGGIMPVGQYRDQLDEVNRQCFDQPAESKSGVQYIEYHWENAPIVRAGDELIFFGELQSDGTLRSTYFMQGVFPVEDDTVSVTEQTVDEFLYEDFHARFGDTVSAEALLASASA